MNRLFCLTAFVFWGTCLSCLCQPEDLTQVWPAQWIKAKDGPSREFGVFYFRKSFLLEKVPEKLVVHTSGDMRYQLYVNGQKLTWGPLTGDLRHWYFESTDLAPFLKEGENTLAAVVLNYGSHPPDARLSVQTGFLLAADDRNFRFLNTGPTWKAIHNPGYSASRVEKSQISGYYGGGSREAIDGRKSIWDWESPTFNDSLWKNAEVIEQAYARTCRWASRWKLTPRTLPHERLEVQRIPRLRLAEGVAAAEGFPNRKTRQTIPARSKVRLVFDHQVETTAYPVWILSKGKDARMQIRYSEAPVLPQDKKGPKGNRNDLTGKIFKGYCDLIQTDGGLQRRYSPLWWRAFRYLEVEIETRDEPLEIEDVYTVRSTFPFQTRSAFLVNGHPDPGMGSLVDSMFSVGIRTTQLCSHETFVDCPYYEESQFEGDTRIEALVSYYNFGDPSLGKNAIEQFAWSLNEEGFLSARYPTQSFYYIPNFSLYWIGMVNDYFQYTGDREFVRRQLPVSRHILEYFFRHQREDGTVKKLDYHTFVDWAFPNGESPVGKTGYSALADVHLMLALQWAEQLETLCGEPDRAGFYRRKAESLRKTFQNQYWKPERGLYSDTPEGDRFSQHTNSLAVLTGMVKGNEARILMEKVLRRENMTIATLYFQFYVAEAMRRAGLGGAYLENLQAWKEVLELGVTTWPETGPESRSECHGWGASPNYHFFTLVCGIEPLEPGFGKVGIAPDFGRAQKLEAQMPIPAGILRMNLRKTGKSGLKGEVDLPGNTTAVLRWQNREYTLQPGLQTVNLPD